MRHVFPRRKGSTAGGTITLTGNLSRKFVRKCGTTTVQVKSGKLKRLSELDAQADSFGCEQPIYSCPVDPRPMPVVRHFGGNRLFGILPILSFFICTA
jgi:hypothetical protein